LLHAIESNAIDFVRWLFDTVGWFGVVVAMTIESACIPLPSEIIMPLAGWLIVDERDLGWWGIIQASFWGAVGNVIGSIIAYWAGALGGRPLVLKYGKWILITRKDLDRADRLFAKWGEEMAFASRLLPVVRTFISFPAGVSRMNFPKFVIYTFLGAFLWCIPLTWAGYHWGADWEEFRERARLLDYPIAAVIVALAAWYIWHKIKEIRHESAMDKAEEIAAASRPAMTQNPDPESL
jgi:membrane protein DedA with SNARE-associated domain